MKQKGLVLFILKDAGTIASTSNGGISSRADKCVLLGIVDHRRRTTDRTRLRRVAKHCQVFEPSEDTPAVWLVLGRHSETNVFMQPGDPETGEYDPDEHYMAGGAYVTTSDSRWADILRSWLDISEVAIRLHDRQEF